MDGAGAAWREIYRDLLGFQKSIEDKAGRDELQKLLDRVRAEIAEGDQHILDRTEARVEMLKEDLKTVHNDVQGNTAQAGQAITALGDLHADVRTLAQSLESVKTDLQSFRSGAWDIIWKAGGALILLFLAGQELALEALFL
ncbi:MAG: hypothetical protein AAGK02_09695 [Pseudomonadota bacterium]